MCKAPWRVWAMVGCVMLAVGCEPAAPTPNRDGNTGTPANSAAQPAGEDATWPAPLEGSGETTTEQPDAAPPFPTESSSDAGGPSAARSSATSGRSAAAGTPSTSRTNSTGATNSSVAAADQEPIPSDPLEMTDDQWKTKLEEAIRRGESKEDYDEAVQLVDHVIEMPTASPDRIAQAMIIYSGVARQKKSQGQMDAIEPLVVKAIQLAQRLMSTPEAVPDKYREVAGAVALENLVILGDVPAGLDAASLAMKAMELNWAGFDTLKDPEWQVLLEKHPELTSLFEAGRERAVTREMELVAREMAVFRSFPFEIDLPDVATGKPLKVADFKGKVLLVDFWATWCPPCLEELPNLIEAQEKYGPQGLQIVGLADETPAGDDPAQVLIKFMEEKGMNYPNALMTQEVALQLPDPGPLPTKVAIDRTGRVRLVRLGPLRSWELEAIVKALLAESPAAID